MQGGRGVPGTTGGAGAPGEQAWQILPRDMVGILYSAVQVSPWCVDKFLFTVAGFVESKYHMRRMLKPTLPESTTGKTLQSPRKTFKTRNKGFKLKTLILVWQSKPILRLVARW